MPTITAPAPAAIAPTVFDRTGRLDPIGGCPGAFAVQLDPAWTSLVGIHGGYLASLAVRAVERVAAPTGHAVRTVATSFLRAGRPGPATVEVAAVREGRSVSSYTASIVQEGRLLNSSRITLVARRAGEEWETSTVSALPPIEACVPPQPPDGIRHFEHAVARIDPAHEPFSGRDEARIGGYVRPVEARPIDAAWLVMLADWFPPVAFTRVMPPTGGISVDLVVHVHRTLDGLGADEWLSGSFAAAISHDSLALETGEIRDPAGRVIAESFHTRYTG